MNDKYTKETLRYEFSDAEINELAKEQAQKLKDRATTVEEKKRIASQYKSRIEILDGEIERITDCVNSGYEMRPVECVIHFNDPEPGQKRIVRTDTEVTVRLEKMTELEKQVQIDFEEGEEADEPEEDEDNE